MASGEYAMKWGALSKAAITALTAYSLSFSDSLSLNLQNISEKLNYRLENGELAKDSLAVTDYSQIKDLTKEIYAKLTGRHRLPGIAILDSEKFSEIKRAGSNIEDSISYSEFYSKARDSVYVKQKGFGELMVIISHGIGHSTDRDLAEWKGLEGKIAEEAKAIAFSRAWTEELSKHVFLDNDPSKSNVQFGRLQYEREDMPLHYVADLLVERIKTEKPTFLDVYRTVITKDLDELIEYIKTDRTFIALKEKRITSRAYKGF